MQTHIALRPVRNAHEWTRCFAAVEQPHFTQADTYGQAKCQAGRWHVERLVFEAGGTPLAICQVLDKRIAGLRVASRINRGPLFLDPAPSRAQVEQVYALLRRRWRHGVGGALAIAPALAPNEENRDLLLRLGFKDRKAGGWCSSLIDLRKQSGEWMAALAPAWRNRLRAALASDLQLHCSHAFSDFAWMMERHQQNMRELRFQGPERAFLADLYASRPADFMVLQARLDGVPVAGMLLARFGHSAEYFIGWFGEAGRAFNSGNFLYWHALLQMKEAGCKWFDLGGYSTRERYGHFKQNMRGQSYRLIGEWMAY